MPTDAAPLPVPAPEIAALTLKPPLPPPPPTLCARRPIELPPVVSTSPMTEEVTQLAVPPVPALPPRPTLAAPLPVPAADPATVTLKPPLPPPPPTDCATMADEFDWAVCTLLRTVRSTLEPLPPPAPLPPSPTPTAPLPVPAPEPATETSKPPLPPPPPTDCARMPPDLEPSV